MQSPRVFMAAGLCGVICLALGIFIGSSRITASDAPLETRRELMDLSDAFAEIAEHVNPSVVHISCVGPEVAEEREELQEEEQDESPFGFGSGVIINPEGYILTSSHVIDSAAKIEVKLSDNRQFIAKLIGQDRETDLALIKVDSENPLPAAPMGDSDRLRPGQLVMAIGNPFVYDHTVTVGVISALNRKLGTTIFDNFIQTDAAINFGNSGGPLLNVKGEVIGINTLISSQGTGIGFSIPINMAKEILPQLMEKGKVRRGFLGLVPQDITPDLQTALGLSQKEGVIISSVQRDTPAAKAGLKRYDVIVEFDGKKVQTEDQFRRYVAETPPGRKIRLRVLRDQESLEILSELMERDLVEAKAPEIPLQKKESDRVGWKIENLQAAHPVLQPDHEKGVVIQHIQSGRAADIAGLRTGDIILEANKKPVADAAALEKVIAEAKKGEIFLLYIYRFGSYLVVTLQVP
ncbi:Do family serine endopeptidase [bacterium]|nr:Do family serine endopeptidase [bacterium]MCI0606137.1 Do family serine endopeptidase [bacterium]